MASSTKGNRGVISTVLILSGHKFSYKGAGIFDVDVETHKEADKIVESLEEQGATYSQNYDHKNNNLRIA